MSTGIATYYDRLGRWNRAARSFGYGGGSSSLTVHRALADPRAQGRPTFTRLHDLLLERLPALSRPRVLDAGCGLGGTMIALAQALGATCSGVTLSDMQARTANDAAARSGLASQVHAAVGSYDHPPEGPFDLIVAIESLAHSADPAASVSALISVLAPGGWFIVVDDMPEPAAIGTADLATFKAGWQCPVLWRRDQYVEAFARAGLDLRASVDLSGECRPRTRQRVGQLMILNRLARGVVPRAVRQVLESHQGGLALERLLRDGTMRYRMLVAHRPVVQVS